MNKKQLFLVILSWVFLSAFTSFMALPSINSLSNFIAGFFICFVFWGLLFYIPMLGEAFEDKKTETNS